MFVSIYFSSSAQDYFQFAAREKYYFSDNEKNLSIDTNVLRIYDLLNTDLVHQVPLNRYVEANKYNLYIGLAVFDLPESIIDYYKNNPEYEILLSDKQKIKKDTYYKLLCKLDNKYIYKVIFLTRKSKYTVVLNYVCDNYGFLKSLYFDKNFINSKLKRTRKKLK